MKIQFSKMLVLLVTVCLLAGCSSGMASSAAPTLAPAPQPALSPTPRPMGEGEAALTLVPEWPDYYPYTVKSNPDVPDFLTEDQQDLFRAAVRMYDGIGGTSPGYLVQYTATMTVSDGETPSYALDEGFSSYADFTAALQAVFTEDYCQSILAREGQPLREYEGRLYAVLADRGTNIEYVTTRYALLSADDNAIEFNLIGLYNPGAATFENPTETRDASQDYTIEYPIRMEFTEHGWRFANFAKPN